MLNIINYGPGGYDPEATNGNRAEESNGDAGTYTRWNADGSVAETRPLTAAELAASQPPTRRPPSPLESARAELERAVAVAAAPEKLAVVNALALAEEGVTDGQGWRQPYGAHDAYPQGFTVSHGGKTWESLTPANVWVPGVSGWREVVPPAAGPAAWVQPTGGHDAYKTGDRVTFEGKVYESVIGGNVWSPTAHPAGWKIIPA